MKKLQKLTAWMLVCSMVLGMFLPKTAAAATESRVSDRIEMESIAGHLTGGAMMAEDHNPSGGKHVVINDMEAASSFDFKINAEAAGNYQFDFCYIAGDKGQPGKNDPRQIRFEVNEENQGLYEFASTDSWDVWMTKSMILPLKAGENTIKLTGNGTGNGICIDYFNFEKTENQNVPSGAAIYEAEDGELSGGTRLMSDHAGYTGKGFAAGFDFNDDGEVTFHVNVQSSGDFKIAMRYSAGKVDGWPDERRIGLRVNGAEQEELILPTTENWDSWKEKIQNVSLNEGDNTITIHNVAAQNDNVDAINVDHLSLWKEVETPELTKVYFEQDSYVLKAGEMTELKLLGLYSDECHRVVSENYTLASSREDIVKVSGKNITGEKNGKSEVTASYEGLTAKTDVYVGMIATVDFGNEIKPYDPSMFGYILTPNYDVADSRVKLLGPLLNRDSIPAQNFQSISDGDPALYEYEDSILQRAYEGYSRATKDLGTEFYFLLGHLPSWVTGAGDNLVPGTIPWQGTPDNLPWMKQYIKDTLQYFKDRGADFKFADLINENWTGGRPTYKALWEALREVYPEEVPAVGPGEFDYDFQPDMMIPYVAENNITLEGPSWHAFWGLPDTIPLKTMQSWKDSVEALQKQYPQTNGKYIIFEENNTNVDDVSVWARDMMNTVRAGITQSIKGCYDEDGWNGMSNLLRADKSRQNTGYRTEQWWLYYAYSLMSGMVVESSTMDEEDGYAVLGYKDEKESKVMVTTPFVAGDYSLQIDLENQPYAGKDVVVEAYKIIDNPNENPKLERDGLKHRKTFTFNMSEKDLAVELEGLHENETWILVLKEKASAPGFVHPMTPDDGEAATTLPQLTWSAAQGAEDYEIIVSKNADLSNPVVHKTGIKGTDWQVDQLLETGQKYYWTVIAHNQYGETKVVHDVAYMFHVMESEAVPGQFGPYMPSMEAPNESVTTEFKWSTAYRADSYRLVVSKNEDLSNPVIDEAGITNVRNTPQFGQNSQAYYTPKTPLEYDTTYYWMVYAANADGERPMNGPVHKFTTKAEGNRPTAFKLNTPAIKEGSNGVDTRVVLDWEASKNAFFYDLRVSKNADMSDPVLVRDRMIYNRYTMEPNLLEPNTKYYWTVTAYTKDLKYKTSTESKVQSFTTEAAASAPLLYAEHADGNDVTLWFQKSNTASSYKIVYGTQPGNYTMEIKEVTESPYVAEDMMPGTYYFAVIAQNEAGESSIWNEREVTVTQEGSQANPGVEIKTEPKPTPPEITVTPEPKPSAPAKGSVHKSGKLVFKVLSSNEAGRTVQVLRPKKKTYKKIVVPTQVTLNGYRFKVTQIGKRAFKNNRNLKEVKLGKYVSVIGSEALAKCKKLKKVTIGTGLKRIEKKAFYGDKSLKKIVLKSKKLKKVSKQAFKGIHKKAVIDVPNKKVRAYKNRLKGKITKGVKIK